MGFSVAENPDAKRHDLSEFRVCCKSLLRISMKSSCALSLNKLGGARVKSEHFGVGTVYRHTAGLPVVPRPINTCPVDIRTI